MSARTGVAALAGEYGATWPMAAMAVLSGACAVALGPQRAAPDPSTGFLKGGLLTATPPPESRGCRIRPRAFEEERDR